MSGAVPVHCNRDVLSPSLAMYSSVYKYMGVVIYVAEHMKTIIVNVLMSYKHDTLTPNCGISIQCT